MNGVTLTFMERQIPGELFTSPLSALEVSSILEAYVYDVHGGINEEWVRAYNELHNTTLIVKQAILIHLYQSERYLRCSGGAWSRASGYYLVGNNGRKFHATTSRPI